MNASRLDACGWTSIKPELFFKDQGRKSRNVGDDFIRIINKFCKGTNILELCSGGGKLLIQLARAGFTVTGMDLSNEMLDICRQDIKKENKDVQNRLRIVHEDICVFDLKAKFDFIILEDDGFMYLLTKEDQLSCLHRVHDHLTGEGLFFLSFATPQKELSSSGDYTYEPISQIKTQTCLWTLYDEGDRQKEVRQGIERRRVTYPEELEQLFKKTKLSPVERWGDLQMHPFTDPATQEYNYLIKKQS